MVILFLIINAIMTFFFGAMYAAVCEKYERGEGKLAPFLMMIAFYFVAVASAIGAALAK